jgi:hypothetical protein
VFVLLALMGGSVPAGVIIKPPTFPEAAPSHVVQEPPTYTSSSVSR